jgi:riboflavin synthase
MFTGLVQCLAAVRAVRSMPPGKRIDIAFSPDGEVALGQIARGDVALGDSVAINGCCLTMVGGGDECLAFDAGPETLARTNLGELTAGSAVNIELSLRVGDRLGGHFVSGHIEGVGTLAERRDERDWSTLWFNYPHELGRYMVAKGSIAVDGVSLTLVDVEQERFSVALIPHTLQATTLGRLGVGARVNLETDLLAKYAQKKAEAL